MDTSLHHHIVTNCCSSQCGCGPTKAPVAPKATSRREFVAGTGALLGASLLNPMRAVAGPFADLDRSEFPIPKDKKLSAEWRTSLSARGEPTEYSSLRGELNYIGMPIGGICTGQLYLGGDGRLWHWDIFNLPASNEWRSTQGPHYARPARPASPIEQGFALRVRRNSGETDRIRGLDLTGFRDIRFRGQYPIASIEYRDADCPVTVTLEAFSPFIPLNEDDSGIPATIMSFTIRNTSSAPVSVELNGWLQNAACLNSGREGRGERRNRTRRDQVASWIECDCVASVTTPASAPSRADIVFERFEAPTYEGWTVTGTAFGDGPIATRDMPVYQGNVNAEGTRTVNTHNARGGEDVVQADQHIGTLLSREFTIERNFVSFRIGGGNHPGQTCVNLLMDGAPVRTATGQNSNRMRLERFDVREFAGRSARIQIVDAFRGGWGQIGVDEIIFTDAQAATIDDLSAEPDHGSMALGVIGLGPSDRVATLMPDGPFPHSAFEPALEAAESRRAFGSRLIGGISRIVALGANESSTITFIVAWHFDGLWWDSLEPIEGIRGLRRHYGSRFRSAADVMRYVIENFDRLAGHTRLWHRTWYDSTLPHWFLERTIANTSTLATATCYRFSNGRFYGWEGTYCCAGTCQHVWQYAQAVARLFPNLERYLREHVDFGSSFHATTGELDYRGEAAKSVAHDGMAGTIIRAYREHLTSPDGAYLKRIWSRVRMAMEYLIREDPNEDGVLEGAQYNTLDATWYGPMAWISSLYLAAVRAAQAMAEQMIDVDFAARCRAIVARGGASIVDKLFNGEYFIHKPDPAHPEANATGDGCHIDQVFGQSMAHQVGLGRILPREQTLSALRSLWNFSFAPDVGVYRARFDAEIKGGRWYAMPGEGGLLMCTWPRGGQERATGKGNEAWAAGYFSECMSGFEHQVASHMIWEGMVEEGLAITRMIHDRYHAARRNPFNEVECSDHYARAMASYGSFIAACGFEYDGPAGFMAFDPRLNIGGRFRAAFTSAEGWGTISQEVSEGRKSAEIAVAAGTLRLRAIRLAWPGTDASRLRVNVGGGDAAFVANADVERVVITLKEDARIRAGQSINVSFA